MSERERDRRIMRRGLWMLTLVFGAICALVSALAIVVRMY